MTLSREQLATFMIELAQKHAYVVADKSEYPAVRWIARALARILLDEVPYAGGSPSAISDFENSKYHMYDVLCYIEKFLQELEQFKSTYPDPKEEE